MTVIRDRREWGVGPTAGRRGGRAWRRGDRLVWVIDLVEPLEGAENTRPRGKSGWRGVRRVELVAESVLELVVCDLFEDLL